MLQKNKFEYENGSTSFAGQNKKEQDEWIGDKRFSPHQFTLHEPILCKDHASAEKSCGLQCRNKVGKQSREYRQPHVCDIEQILFGSGQRRNFLAAVHQSQPGAFDGLTCNTLEISIQKVEKYWNFLIVFMEYR